MTKAERSLRYGESVESMFIPAFVSILYVNKMIESGKLTVDELKNLAEINCKEFNHDQFTNKFKEILTKQNLKTALLRVGYRIFEAPNKIKKIIEKQSSKQVRKIYRIKRSSK